MKYPLADYELLPKMAIVDADNCMTAPRGLTAASGIDVMTHAIEAYVSIMASDYTEGPSERAASSSLRTCPRLHERRQRPAGPREDGQRLLHGRYGLRQRLPGPQPLHGAQARRFPPPAPRRGKRRHPDEVMRYNAAEVPTKMGTFSQYPYPHALANYAEMAVCGIEGKDDKEVFENLIRQLEELKDFIGVKKTIADYGVDEKYFLDTLDEMTEQAFNDQCTGANPRYPLMSEIKELYLDAYYGREPQDYAVC